VSNGTTLLVLGDTGLHVVDTAANSVGPTLPLKAFPSAFSLGDQTLAVFYGLKAPDGAQVRQYDLAGNEIAAITVDPDGAQAAGVATIGSKVFAALRAAGKVVVVDTATATVGASIDVLPPAGIDPRTGQPQGRPFELTAHDTDLWVVGPDGAFRLTGATGPAEAVSVDASNGLFSAGGRLWAVGSRELSVLDGDAFVAVTLEVPGAPKVVSQPSVLAIGG
jgi:hypothetical protein